MRVGWRVAAAATMTGAALVSVLTGCGFVNAHNPSRHGADTTRSAHTGAGGEQVIRVVGTEQMRFVPNVIRAHTGKLRIVLSSRGATPHDLKIPELHASTGMVRRGKPGSIEVDLPRPGRYNFICTYHERQGMTGVIKVS